MNTIIAKNIRHLRNTANISQEKFGKQFRINRGMVDSYERMVCGPSPDLVAAIAAHYKIPVEILMSRDLSTNPALAIPGVFDGSFKTGLDTFDIINAKDETIKILKDQIALLERTIKMQNQTIQAMAAQRSI